MMHFSIQTNEGNFVKKENNVNELKRICRQHQEKLIELQGAIDKEITVKSQAVQNENMELKKKLQELEDLHTKTKADLEYLKKKYDMTRRLCNLRNDDNAKLKNEVCDLKGQVYILNKTLESKNQ